MARIVLLSSLLLSFLVSGTIAFNITKILNQYSDYAIFNQELSKTDVAGEVNKRKSVTVLVVPNGAMSGITSKKDDSLENIMRVHVILDYYDSAKIKKLEDETTLTTLYQTTGSADKKEGFIKVSKDDNEIKLGSAVSGAQMSAKVNKVVTSVPSDVSVIEISSPIVPPGLDGSCSSPTPAPAPSPDSSSSSSPSPSPDASSVDSSSPAPSYAPAPSHKKHKHAPAPAPSDAPAPSHKKHKHKHAPAPAPSDDDSDDTDEGDDTSAEEEDSSSSRNAVLSGVMLLASFVATL